MHQSTIEAACACLAASAASDAIEEHGSTAAIKVVAVLLRTQIPSDQLVLLLLLWCMLPARIPFKDLLGLTGLLLTCSYKGSEFVRVGWYVHIEYTDPDVDPEHPPNPPRIDQLQRNILAGEWCPSYAGSAGLCW